MYSYYRPTRNAAVAAVVILFTPFLSLLSAQEEKNDSVKELNKILDEMRTNYEKRISDLELTMELMESQAETGQGDNSKISKGVRTREEVAVFDQSMGTSPGLMGQLGQTDRFSSTFNPAVGVVLDTLSHFSTDKESHHGQDRFWFRAAELSLSANIDPFGYGYAVIEGSEDESIEVIEAAAVMNRLPWNFSVKGGRLLADVTKFGQRHDHELPFVEKPGALNEFIGGSLQGTGFEVHQWFGISDTVPVRWSVGMFTELHGHSHAIGSEHSHDHDHSSTSKRHLDNFHYSGRLTTYMDLDEENSVQLGTSLWWAPDTLTEEEDERFHTHRAVGSFDVTYKWQDPASRKTFFLGGEALVSNGKFLHEHEVAGVTHHEILDEEALGGYAWCEYSWDPHWSAGLMADAFSHVEHAEIGQRDYSTFLTWKISHFNWLRFQYRYNDLERGHGSMGRDYHEFMLQWTITLGSHAHGLDW